MEEEQQDVLVIVGIAAFVIVVLLLIVQTILLENAKDDRDFARSTITLQSNDLSTQVAVHNALVAAATQAAFDGGVSGAAAAAAIEAAATREADLLSAADLNAQNNAATIEAQAGEIATLEAASQPVSDVNVTGLFLWERFDQNSVWPVAELATGGTVTIADGEYVWNVTTPPNTLQTLNPQFPILDNNYVEYEAAIEECSPNGAFALIYRAQEDFTGYYFWVSCDFTLWDIQFIRSRTEIESLGSGQIGLAEPDLESRHHLGILAQDASMTLYLDGNVIATVQDATIAEGRLGFVVTANEQPVTIRFDNLRVWAVPQAAAITG